MTEGFALWKCPLCSKEVKIIEDKDPICCFCRYGFLDTQYLIMIVGKENRVTETRGLWINPNYRYTRLPPLVPDTYSEDKLKAHYAREDREKREEEAKWVNRYE